MAIKTKNVSNRRQVSFQSYDDFLADVENLASGNVELLGNWTLAQICQHMAAALNGSIDGISFRAPFPLRVFGKLCLKNRFLNRGLPAGFKIPGRAKKQFEPTTSLDQEEQIKALRQAINRVKTDSTRALHPFFDAISTEEWDKFNLRHAELHMSFVKAVD